MENDIFINGQKIRLEWDQSSASGSGILNLPNSKTRIHAFWQLTCLSGGNVKSEDLKGVQVLNFVIDSPEWTSGFTVSFQQHHPRIVQFVPSSTDISTIEANSVFWRTPSLRFSPISISSDKNTNIIEFANSRQKSLQSGLQRLGIIIGNKVDVVKNIANNALKKCRYHFAPVHRVIDNLSEQLRKIFCPQRKSGPGSSNYVEEVSHIPADTILIDSPVEFRPQGLVPTPTNAHSSPPSATQTRSLTTSGFSDHRKVIGSFSPTDIDQRSHNLRALSIIVLVSALLFWTFKRFRDPRRRVDRAARREERQRRCLYKRAARIQAFRNWFCAIRRTVYPQQAPTSWDEKRARVIEQEEILEAVMKDNIRTLRHTYHVENNIEAAEEGRNGYMYEVGSSSRSDRRRSFTTLPGYESEATQPPGYDSDTVSVTDGFRYTPVESEDTPDSSVISTSPRISRDGRDSDFGKENVAEWTLESRQTIDFRI